MEKAGRDLKIISTMRNTYLGKPEEQEDGGILIVDSIEISSAEDPVSNALLYTRKTIECELMDVKILSRKVVESEREAVDEKFYVDILFKLAVRAERKSKSGMIMQELSRAVQELNV